MIYFSVFISAKQCTFAVKWSMNCLLKKKLKIFLTVIAKKNELICLITRYFHQCLIYHSIMLITIVLDMCSSRLSFFFSFNAYLSSKEKNHNEDWWLLLFKFTCNVAFFTVSDHVDTFFHFTLSFLGVLCQIIWGNAGSRFKKNSIVSLTKICIWMNFEETHFR